MRTWLSLILVVLAANPTPHERGWVFCTKTSGFIPVNSSTLIAMDNPDENGNEKGNRNQGAKKKNYTLYLIPCASPYNPGSNDFTLTGISSMPAGEPFSVLGVILDEENSLASANGNFRFTWSHNNFIDPVNPHRAKPPIDTHWDYTFSCGICRIESIHYDECGSIVLTGMANVTIGESPQHVVLQATSQSIQFYPHHYGLTVEQPPAIQGKEAQYTYAGQPFSATVTIQAFNAREPSEQTENFESSSEDATRQSLTITGKPALESGIHLEVSPPPIVFSRGEATICLNPMRLVFDEVTEPRSISFQYHFEDRYQRSGDSETSPMEFRSGRLHILDKLGIAGDSSRIAMNIEEYRDGQWRLNRQEEILAITPADLLLDPEDSALQIVGDQTVFFGGRIRGGEQPLRIALESWMDDRHFSITLSSKSALAEFLDVVPGQWRIYRPRSARNRYGYLIRNRVLYEKEI